MNTDETKTYKLQGGRGSVPIGLSELANRDVVKYMIAIRLG